MGGLWGCNKDSDSSTGRWGVSVGPSIANNKACCRLNCDGALTLLYYPCMAFRYFYVEAGGLCDVQFMGDVLLGRFLPYYFCLPYKTTTHLQVLIMRYLRNSGIGCTDSFLLSCPDFYSGSHSVPGSTILQEVTTTLCCVRHLSYNNIQQTCGGIRCNLIHLSALGWK